jgi:hypothetical protein
MTTTVAGCGAPTGGYGIDGIDRTKEAVIQGVVTSSAGEPVTNAYVRLLDRSGEFTAEVQTSEQGEFRFFASTGTWTLRVLAPSVERVDRDVEAQTGQVADVAITV